jgi:hypothetical protein
MTKEPKLLVIEKNIGARLVSKDDGLMILEVNMGCIDKVKMIGPVSKKVIEGLKVVEKSEKESND